MTGDIANWVVSGFVLFCRVGACLMLMPGFSSARIPAQIRILVAIAASMALIPPLADGIRAALPDLHSSKFLELLVSEIMVGGVIGLLGRILMSSLEFAATAIASYIGVAGVPGITSETGETPGALASIVTLGATVMLFVTDQHVEVIHGLVDSYANWPVGKPHQIEGDVFRLLHVLSSSYDVLFRLASPFLVYGVVVNFAFGVINRLVPQIPVYMVSAPILIAGGLWLLHVIAGRLLHLFMDHFMQWLATG